MNPTLIHQPTKCILCGHVFKSDLLGSAAIVGSNPKAKLQQVAAMVNPLMKHLQKSHPDAIQAAQMSGGEFAGYLMVSKCFEMDNATAEKLGTDYTRWSVHRLTARKEAHPSNERIRDRAREVWSSTDWKTRGTAESDTVFEGMVTLLCEMRDAIEEKDRYSTPQPVSENENGKRN
jgi:hypothetical protein